MATRSELPDTSELSRFAEVRTPANYAVGRNPEARSPADYAEARNPETRGPADYVEARNPETRGPADYAEARNPETRGPADYAVGRNPEARSPADYIEARNPEARSSADYVEARNPEVRYPATRISTDYAEDRKPAEAYTYVQTSGLVPSAQDFSNKNLQVSDLGALRISGRTLLLGFLVVLIFVLVLYLAMAHPGCDGRKLAQDLAASGWVLYTRPGCRFCDLQMQILGTKEYPKLVRCNPTMMRTHCKNLQGFPCWINEYTHKKHIGLLNRTQLEQMCA